MVIRLSLQEDAIEETHEINVTPFVAAPLSTVR
jgi:hypothetical protein